MIDRILEKGKAKELTRLGRTELLSRPKIFIWSIKKNNGKKINKENDPGRRVLNGSFSHLILIKLIIISTKS